MPLDRSIAPAQRLALTEAVAQEAGAVALRHFRNLDNLKVEQKAPQDLVSEADREVERVIRGRLNALFPGELVLGEEEGADEGDLDAGCWVVDPIDGTWCFLNGIASWCVSIAYVSRGRYEVGVIFDPNTGETFSARVGNGATLNGRPMRVRDVPDFSEGSVSVGASRRTKTEEIAPVLEGLVARGGLYHRHGSGSLGLAWTAAGRLIAYLEPHMNSWDALAGYVLLREAGAWTNDFLGGRGLREGNPVLASGPSLKNELIELTAHWGERFLAET